jgi:uncharacterized protein YndB with AHSA1/START domain
MRQDSAVQPLVVQRTVRAPVERCFDAWTRPEHLTRWWGPAGVSCPEASVDLRVGGAYRIANLFADGSTVWISGIFERVEPPSLLVYTWRTDPGAERDERVTVTFEAVPGGTRVSIRHEGIPDASVREQHAAGWEGCLDGLVQLLAPTAGRPTR